MGRHDNETRIANLIAMLPARFDKGKISIESFWLEFNHTYFSEMLTAKRPNMTFLTYFVDFDEHHYST